MTHLRIFLMEEILKQTNKIILKETKELSKLQKNSKKTQHKY